MRIEVEKQIDAETKEIWSFNLFDLNAVFVAWHREVKPKGKRKQTIQAFWDKYGRHDYKMSEEPVLPEIIRSEALSKVMECVRIHTWSEWKARQSCRTMQQVFAELHRLAGGFETLN